MANTPSSITISRLAVLGSAALALTGFVALAALTVSYGIYPTFLDHGEPLNTLLTLRGFEGKQVYPRLDGPDRTTNLLGPVYYLLNLTAFELLGPGVATAKWPVLLSALVLPLVVFVSHRNRGPALALLGSTLAAAYVMLTLPLSLLVRPDSMIALLVAVAMCVANRGECGRPMPIRSIIIGLCLGLASGMKVHAGVYFLPIAIVHSMGRPVMRLVVMAAAAGTVAGVPFLAEIFSLSGYLSWFVPLAIEKQHSPELLAKTVRYSVLYLAPAGLLVLAHVVAGVRMEATTKVYVGAFVISVGLVLFPASKVGAGSHYLYPFAAVAVDMLTRCFDGRGRGIHAIRVLGVALVLLCSAISIPMQKRFHRSLHWDEARGLVNDIVRAIESYPERDIGMGLGQDWPTYKRTYVRAHLVLQGHPYRLDWATLTETSNLGIPFPKEAVARLHTCDPDVWLVPKDEMPFAMISYYERPMVTEQFLKTFRLSYSKDRTFAYLDAWVCTRHR